MVATGHKPTAVAHFRGKTVVEAVQGERAVGLLHVQVPVSVAVPEVVGGPTHPNATKSARGNGQSLGAFAAAVEHQAHGKFERTVGQVVLANILNIHLVDNGKRNTPFQSVAKWSNRIAEVKGFRVDGKAGAHPQR